MAPKTVKCVVTHTIRSGMLSSRVTPSVIHSDRSSSHQAHRISSPSVMFGTSSSTVIGSAKSKIEISFPDSSTSRMLIGCAANRGGSSSCPASTAGLNDAATSGSKTVTTATAPSGIAADGTAITTLEPSIGIATLSTPSDDVTTSRLPVLMAAAVIVLPSSVWTVTTSSPLSKMLVIKASSCSFAAFRTSVAAIVVVVVVVVGPGVCDCVGCVTTLTVVDVDVDEEVSELVVVLVLEELPDVEDWLDVVERVVVLVVETV
mmetsp:Transcript_57832/g.135194  ORF Transcript_57832/g.135194 Transcript_57832/m.135194 type:complete len:261 (-) Transcript_57832:1868-2650(-)